jgi:crotonobetainyl-CoA:carnitine CoA-transferase CaiB-like acyl-CoA transferase
VTDPRPEGPLSGIRVIDMATVVAGPGAARQLADFGATVLKVEPPAGESTRRMGWKADNEADSLMWKLVNRGKYAITIDLKDPVGVNRFLQLATECDVLIENLRPGKLESLGIGPDVLQALNPKLVILRVSGFGQDGPNSQQPGFATTAEALSGMASILGEPGHGPSLPPFALSDEVASLIGAFSVLLALRSAEASGVGQVIDVNLLEAALQILGPLPAAWAALGYLQPQLGSGLPFSVPRGTYQTSDGVWVAISTTAETIATRVVKLIGAGNDPRFDGFANRLQHREALEVITAEWIAQRTYEEVLTAFTGADAAIARVNDMSQVVVDEQIKARNALVDVDGVLMQNVSARLSRTPGRVSSAGPLLNAHNALFADGWPD